MPTTSSTSTQMTTTSTTSSTISSSSMPSTANTTTSKATTSTGQITTTIRTTTATASPTACGSMTCLHAAYCWLSNDTYKCACVAGFTGSSCDTDVDECMDSICSRRDSSAACKNLYGSFNCSCSGDWTGDLCDHTKQVKDLANDMVKGGGPLDRVPELSGQNNTLAVGSMIGDAVPYVVAQLTEQERINMSWSYDEIFEWCTFEGHECNIRQDFPIWNDIPLGNCFTFNHRNMTKRFKLQRAGVGFGLSVGLRTIIKEYASWTQTAGFRIFVHDHNEDVFMESTSYCSAPGERTSIALKQNRVLRLDDPYGTCMDSSDSMPDYYYEGTYTEEGCIRTCYQKEIKKVCGCMDPSFPAPSTERYCTLDKRDCVLSFQANNNVEYGDWSGCNCIKPCDVKLFPAMTMRTQLRNHRTVEVDIYFLDTSDIQFQEVPQITFLTFLSNVGGIVGVLTGLSVVTLIEFAFTLFQALFTLITAKSLII
uniref:EGF-like domain-containing protein n=1 Tax=Plectus sambesii TaxID=2011161 RepID=A0A914WEE9_9BILA